MHISGYQTNRKMTDILQSSTHDLPSSSSSTSFTFHHHQHTHENHDSFPNLLCPVALYRRDIEFQLQQQQQQQPPQVEEVCSGLRKKREREEETENQLSLFDVLVTGFRKSLVACKKEVPSSGMEIGCPMNVRHVAHVTFDRFNGFLGLPVEFEPEVSRRPPSASTRVFGVSTESMQLSFDTRGNSVPTILLMMQRRLYAQGALQVEGIFRINGENGEEESVREQLNRGIVPDNVDVHCLAGLIKAWFRELPTGLLDSLPPEQVMQAESEEQCVHLTRLLPPTEAALLDWAINLMADVAQLQHLNKMNSRNIATVFAPNMTQMADPLTALMFAVKVMNFLKTLIERILRGRQDSIVDIAFADHLEPSDQSGDHDALQPITHDTQEGNEEQVSEDNEELESYYETRDVLVVERENIPKRQQMACKNLVYIGSGKKETIIDQQQKCIKNKNGQSSSNSGDKKASRRSVERPVVYDIYVAENTEKGQDSSIISRVNWRTQRLEAWR